MIGYVKHFDSDKNQNLKVSFKTIDKKLAKKYTKIGERVSSLTNTELDSKPIYCNNDKYIKNKIKKHGDKVNTNFQIRKVPKENASYKCLSLRMLDSVIKPNKMYYPERLLEECKYELKKNKMQNLINDDLDLSSSDKSMI